jgi:rhamnulose-1-phosphate aldolase/alcohol dehydrogenase
MSANRSETPLDQLVERSNRLGSDRRNTNYGGGNTSAKGTATDPVSNADVDVMWVKGSGGDLGTLTASGVSALRLDRLRALKRRYGGIDQDDEMHQLLDHCSFGPPGAAPSIDTSMHGLLEAAHVDHLHPDSVIAVAASEDGEALTREIFGDEIGWVPWQRPGFDLAMKIEKMQDEQPLLRGVIMGGHGVTTWAETSDECEQISLRVIEEAADFIERTGRPEPLGPVRVGFEPLNAADRRIRALAIAPVIRGLASTDQHVVGRWFDDAAVLDFIGREATPLLAPLGTSCPDHFIRTKARPLLLDLPTDAPFDQQSARVRELHHEYRAEYRRYYDRHADDATPPMRGADPAIFLVPGVGMFSFGVDEQTAQIAGEFYINAINVIRGAEAISTYRPVAEAERFGVEYWLLEDLKLRRRPAPRPLTGKVAAVTGTGSRRDVVAAALADAGAVVVRDDGEESVLRYGGIDVVVTHGTPSAIAVKAMVAQGTGGDIVLIGSDPTDRVTALAAELRMHHVRVNGLRFDERSEPFAIADAAVALVDASLRNTTGVTIPVYEAIASEFA